MKTETETDGQTQTDDQINDSVKKRTYLTLH